MSTTAKKTTSKMENTQNEKTLYFGGRRVINSTLRIYFGVISKSGSLVSYVETENRPFIERGLPLIQRRSNIVGLSAAKENLKLDEIWVITPKEYKQREHEYLLKIDLPNLESVVSSIGALTQKNHVLQLIASVTRINQRNSSLVRAKGKRRLIELMSESELAKLKAEREAAKARRDALKLGLEKRAAEEVEYKAKQRLLAQAKDEEREKHNEAIRTSREAAKAAKQAAESVVAKIIKGEI